jgi:uncharacterized protein (DUF58 family)
VRTVAQQTSAQAQTANLAGCALTTAAVFLLVVAVMLGSSALFYMSTAMIATIGASRVQAWLSVRGLRFDRVAPETVTVGDLVTVEIIVWSERRIRRPLVTIYDQIPARLHPTEMSPSLPIAPAFDQPVRTQYQFRPGRRGKFRWSGLVVAGTDALGLVTMSRSYETEPAEITVLPAPIALSIELPHAASWGINEVELGRSRGAGIEPRGIREYVAGDPLRHIHWRTSAKRGTLLVKEFEAGSHAPALFLIQRTIGSEVGQGPMTSFEMMCGHIAYLCDSFLRQGIEVEFPGIEDRPMGTTHMERYREVLELLASIDANKPESLADEFAGAARIAPTGSVLYLLMAAQDRDLPQTVRPFVGSGGTVVALLYDADAFADPKHPVASATDASYVGMLEESGIVTVRIPVEESLGR